MKRIHVIHKTHLDLGFTDLAERITDKYFNEFIINAVRLAEKVNTDNNIDFIWTTGSWLIYHFLEKADAYNKTMLEKAIAKGHIAWHALPFTTHTELLDTDLLEYGISLSEELDRRYHKKTIAAKLTDVPGHTKAIIDTLALHGIKYLHIGVNPASAVPDVPPAFLWRSESGREIIVNYAGEYGKAYKNEYLDEILYFSHTNDNKGPLNEAELNKQLKELETKYPGYEVKASTLDSFAESLWTVKNKLPVLTSEIGDSWIHGSGSDPSKVSRFRELLMLKNKWLSEGSMSKDSREYKNFCDYLLRIAEHTWGMDEKTYLPDFRNYLKQDFIKARKDDKINILKNPPKYYKDCAFANENSTEKSYKRFEDSWAEQREYIDKAISELDMAKQKEALEAINATIPHKDIRHESYQKINTGELLKLGKYSVIFDSDGYIKSLVASDNSELISNGNNFGTIEYQIFGVKDYQYFVDKYLRNYKQTEFWSRLDFTKPGIERYEKSIKDGRYPYKLNAMYLMHGIDSDLVLIDYDIDQALSVDYGAPRAIQAKYKFYKDSDSFDYEINWFDKDASRIPEALWLNFNLSLKNSDCWKMKKLNNFMAVTDIVLNGNRNMSAVEELKYEDEERKFIIKNIHAPLFSLGKGKILEFDNQFASLNEGISYNLYNNVWGTNFPMWYEDDARFVFKFSYSMK